MGDQIAWKKRKRPISVGRELKPKLAYRSPLLIAEEKT